MYIYIKICPPLFVNPPPKHGEKTIMETIAIVRTSCLLPLSSSSSTTKVFFLFIGIASMKPKNKDKKPEKHMT